MKKVIQYLFLLTVILVGSSFIHKDLNEYGKWLEFYNLKDEDFKQVGPGKPIKQEWKSYDLSIKEQKLYNNLYFYSSDSTYFLDLYSYSVLLEKDSKGNLIWEPGDPESKIQLIKKNNLTATTLLYFGTAEIVETAIWRNKFFFELFGFSEVNGTWIPTIWKYDLSKKTTKIFQSTKTFESRKKNYLIEVRLKTIKEKNKRSALP